ncbi:MAG: hypothetical protein AAGB46_17625, partial [Verrucomicrobiota bacterium]
SMDPATPSVESSFPDPVRQFSIFTENKVGRLSDLTKLFSSHNIHVQALTTLDTTDSAILRVVVDDPDQARILLETNSISYSESEILAVEIAGEHDIDNVLAALLEVEVNIHYIYSFVSRPNGRGALAASIEDMDIVTDALGRRNLKVLSQRDISR